MFKKSLLLLLVCVFLGGITSQAHGIHPRPKAKARHSTTHRATKKKSATLQKRQENAYAHSTHIQQTHPRGTALVDNHAYLSLSGNIEHPQRLYPHLSNYLTTPDQWTNYMLASQNRRVATQTLRAEKRWEEIERNLYTIYHAQNSVYDSQENFVQILAGQIPQDTQYILLGEGHDPIVHKQISRFLSELRAQQPEREIILFTESLPESMYLEPAGPNAEAPFIKINNHLHEHQDVFSAASKANITVIGLEPEFVPENKYVLFADIPSHHSKLLWQTLEGMAIRNEQWLQHIEGQRKEHPQALFVIYAGAMHVAYQQPYSIGDALAPAPTYTALFLPYRIVKENHKNLPAISPYDAQCLERDIPPNRFVTFEKPYAIQVGFDARIFLEER